MLVKKIKKSGIIRRGIFMAAAETQAGTGEGWPDFCLADVGFFRVKNEKNTVIGIGFLLQKMFFGDADTDFAKPDGTGSLIPVQLSDSRFQVCVSFKRQLFF